MKKHIPGNRNIGIDLNDILPASGSNKPLFTERNQGRILEFYILGDIDEASEYANWFDVIRNAGPNDILIFHLNSPGGDLFTAIQFMRIIKECQGTTVASIEGACMSAATLIFLGCDAFEVSDHSSFMIHNYSGGTFGKGGEMTSQIEFERTWSYNLLHDIYKDFLTKAEIDSVLDGKDIWLASAQIIERLNKREMIRKKQFKKASTQKSSA